MRAFHASSQSGRAAPAVAARPQVRREPRWATHNSRMVRDASRGESERPEDLLLRQFLGIRGQEETRKSANWIRSKQRADGTWANFHGGQVELAL